MTKHTPHDSGRSVAHAAADPIDAIEFESTVLVRSLELVRRRGELYVEVDRSGYLLLRTLDTMGPADIVTLATTLGLQTSTAARQVATMHTAGLVTRSPAPTDRRRSVITPTDRGRAAMTAVLRRRWNATRDMLADWKRSDLETLASMFARYN
ncbi:MAG: MarR family winged helix-turn-helix transcriptional regulator, partial [Sciscionella sp.]